MEDDLLGSQSKCNISLGPWVNGDYTPNGLNNQDASPLMNNFEKAQ